MAPDAHDVPTRPGLPAALYTPQQIPAYQGNPNIEALPPIRSRADAAALMQRRPPYDPACRGWDTTLRKHLLLDALTFRQPLAVHLDLEERFGRMIRWGYIDRNPVRPGFDLGLDSTVRSLAPAFATTPPFGVAPPSTRAPVRSTGMTIMGMSGVGKSTGVTGVLGTYQQVIGHTEYAGRPLPRVQVVHLTLECPNDGSLRGLCVNFFQTFDALLGTTYQRLYVASRATVDVLLLSMARVAAVHGLGVLVVDEIQHLRQAAPGGEGRMLNFFTQLVNTIGVPVVLVGTYKALGVLGGEFRQARRGSGQGDLIWDRLTPGGQWDLFVEALWEYQYTRDNTPLTPGLLAMLYAESQGIADLAVKLYALAQLRAMTQLDETITPTLIESVAKDSLRLTRPAIQALRRNTSADRDYLRTLEDVLPSVLSRLGEDLSSGEPQRHDPLGGTSEPSTEATPAYAPPGADVTAAVPMPDASRPQPPKQPRGRPRKHATLPVPPDSVRGVVLAGRVRGVAAYQALLDAGLVGAPGAPEWPT